MAYRSIVFLVYVYAIIITYSSSSIFSATADEIPSSTSTSTTTKELSNILSKLSTQITKEGGYVHPALQLVEPAPCGADRGVIYDASSGDDDTRSTDEWLRIPFSYQLTRNLALEKLTSMIPDEVLIEAPLVTLDDAALLVLLLVHLKGASSKKDKWYPYLTSLPDNPTCGWNAESNKVYDKSYDMTDAKKYVQRVSRGMSTDYGPYLSNKHWPKLWKGDAANAIEWALCIVSSRGTAASPTTGGGSTRLLPLVDMFNHKVSSGGFFEITDEEINSKDDEKLEGSFVVRKKNSGMISNVILSGEEITVDYNLADYTADEWFLSHGFVPTEVVDRSTSSRSEL